MKAESNVEKKFSCLVCSWVRKFSIANHEANYFYSFVFYSWVRLFGTTIVISFVTITDSIDLLISKTVQYTEELHLIVICFVTITDSIDLLISKTVQYTEELHLIVNIQTKIFIADKKPFVCHNWESKRVFTLWLIRHFAEMNLHNHDLSLVIIGTHVGYSPHND